ncbi:MULTISPECIES: glycosyl hydrolase [Acidobacteriaceae]|uniref:glycosyl hydrolase n=1 Tax=Acidobacteriaceae TaxID=204434 RepID=UPI00131CBA17|nr:MULTISPECIES: glycosyl hydrolase [Acidobacteriaceae]MDW5266892.1 glycosyl hydrolase [Edaphobacter sp.]
MPANPTKSPRHVAKLSLLAAALACTSLTHLYAKTYITNLHQNFDNPPTSARPMVRWWWFGLAVEKPEILRELQQMKADGIGGAELAFEYPQVLDDSAKGLKNLPFLSPEFLDDVNYAQSEGRKLGLRIDVTLGSGWPYGGPATTLAEASGRLRIAEIPVPANATSLPKLKLAEGESIISIAVANGEPKHWDATTAKTISADQTDHLPLSANPRTALFFISSHTKQEVKRAAAGAEGYVLDPLSHQAVATHLKAVGEPLLKAFGSTPPYAIFSDSLEAYGSDWTPNLPAEFKKRRGYDLLPHLPELVAGGTPEAEKVRHDWGKTLTELVDENYLTQINSWAIAHHTKFRSQTYGNPAVSFSSQRLAALPEGEGPQWRQFSTLRWATSANHVFGNNVTSGETFTWLHSPVFRATPLDMKAEADIDFLTGENQIVCHGWPYSAPQVGEPGWSLYAAGVFNDHNPWHPVMPDVTRYIGGVSYLLRQGQPANQVAILLPTDDAWASFTPTQDSITALMSLVVTPQLMSTILSAGYNVDFIDADAINSVGLGTHKVLILPPTDRIPANTLRKIKQFVAAGGKVISIGRAPSISPEGKALPEITSLSQELFTAAKGSLVPDDSALATALHNAAAPDFEVTSGKDEIGFIRRKLPTSDIYFVANTGNHPIDTTATFATAHKFGEQWNPASGEASSTASNNVQLHLAPYESRIFLFSNTDPKAPAPRTAPTTQLADLSGNWQVRFAATGKTKSEAALTDWIASPDTIHYSGEAVYTRDFNLQSTPNSPTYLQIDGGTPITPPAGVLDRPAPLHDGVPDPRVTRTGPGMRAWFEPPVREAAIVFINGKRAGSLWHPPYRLDVTPFLKPGQNRVEIHVYNTALNAWSALPPHDYKPLIARYGDRFQMQDLNKVVPTSSGILGTIKLVTNESQEQK